MREWLATYRRRLRTLVNRKQLDRDLEDELAFHLAMREAEKRDQGSDPEQARRAVRHRVGNEATLKEKCRELWTFASLESFLHDVRYGLRLLRKNPAFTLVAIITLALGIGANTAIFSLTYQVLLQRLPVPHPDELAVLHIHGYQRGHISDDSEGAEASFSYPLYKELRDRAPVFAGLLARYSIPVSVAGRGFSERAAGELVSGNYFETLGVGPALGRIFTAQEETAPGADTVAVLSYGYWTRRFANNPAVLNQQLIVNGSVLTIVGVARQGFTGVQVGELPDIFIPITMKTQMTPGWNGLDSHRDWWVNVIGRLKPGLGRDQAQSAMQGVFHSILQGEIPQLNFNKKQVELYLQNKLTLEPGAQGRQVLQHDTKQPLLFLVAMVALVLMIACANLAGLLIAKGEARQQEIAVRLSLGARRGRVLRQLVTESLLLAIAGGFAGIGVAQLTLRAIIRAIPPSMGSLGLHRELDPHMLLFAAAISIFTGLLFGLAPAFRVLRSAPNTPLKDHGQNLASSTGDVRVRKWLMVFQVAMTMVLLTAAGLFTVSLFRLQQQDLGMNPSHIIQFSVSPGLSRYSPAQSVVFADRLRESLAAIPGIQTVSAAEVPVFTNTDVGANITVAGYTAQEDEDMHVDQNWVGPKYFSTMGIALLRGREFTDSDSSANAKVAIINEAMAQRWFKGREAIGQMFTFGAGDVHPDIRIVGVVDDSKHGELRETPRRFVYLPYAQHDKLNELTFYIRTAQDPGALTPLITKAVAGLDAGLPVYDLKLLTEQIKDLVFSDRLLAALSLCLGLLAAFLAAIGLYGVMAYVAARRTREIGIRIALGATRQNISWLILREVVQMAAVGLAIGLLCSLFGGRLIQSLLFGVAAGNPLVLAGTAGLLVGVALLAGGLPARRAARLDPVIALRYE